MGLILKGTPHPKFITIFFYDDMDPILTLESFQASPTKPPRGHDPSVQPELVVLAETLQKELHTMGIEGWFFYPHTSTAFQMACYPETNSNLANSSISHFMVQNGGICWFLVERIKTKR